MSFSMISSRAGLFDVMNAKARNLGERLGFRPDATPPNRRPEENCGPLRSPTRNARWSDEPAFITGSAGNLADLPPQHAGKVAARPIRLREARARYARNTAHA